jgi:hypothetical protein
MLVLLIAGNLSVNVVQGFIKFRETRTHDYCTLISLQGAVFVTVHIPIVAILFKKGRGIAFVSLSYPY